jgi:multicomponent Na+:H+ antiporter subunit E
MRGLLWLVLLALAWAAVNGEISGPQLAVGFVLGMVIIVFVRTGRTDYWRKFVALVAFAVYFVVELIVANLRVTRDVLWPRRHFAPGVIGVPLDVEGDTQITLLANLLTLTPGSLTLDLSEDKKTLYIHGMWVADADAARREVKEGFERRVRELFR